MAGHMAQGAAATSPSATPLAPPMKVLNRVLCLWRRKLCLLLHNCQDQSLALTTITGEGEFTPRCFFCKISLSYQRNATVVL